MLDWLRRSLCVVRSGPIIKVWPRELAPALSIQVGIGNCCTSFEPCARDIRFDGLPMQVISGGGWYRVCLELRPLMAHGRFRSSSSTRTNLELAHRPEAGAETIA